MEKIQIKPDSYQEFLKVTNQKTLNTQLYNRWDACCKFIKFFMEFFNYNQEFTFIQSDQIVLIRNEDLGITIKCIQLLHHIIIYLIKQDEVAIKVKMNLKKQVKMMRDSSYYISDKKPFQNIFINSKLLFHTFYLRLIKEDDPSNQKQLWSLPGDVFYLITRFMDVKTMSRKMFGLNAKMNKMGRDNLVWHHIYVNRYKNPGFKVDKVEWKEALIKKEVK